MHLNLDLEIQAMLEHLHSFSLNGVRLSVWGMCFIRAAFPQTPPLNIFFCFFAFLFQ
jgi:hypothetical protein